MRDHSQLYSAYPNMAMTLGLEAVKPPNLDIVPTSANFTIPGQVKVYVLDTSKNVTVLAFTLGAVSCQLKIIIILCLDRYCVNLIDYICRCQGLGTF